MRPENLTGYSFGNLFEHSIEEIWQSEQARWYREQVPEHCLECLELPRCRGGCRSLMVEYDLPGDPLMKAPIRAKEPEILELDPSWKPCPNFTLREQPFGLLLCRYNWSIPLTSDARPMLDALDGVHTLTDIQQQFGDEGLDFIGQLFREGFVEFE